MPPAISFSSNTTTSTKTSSSSIYRPRKQQKMASITQVYFIAHSARSRLSKEAAKPDHDLRRLVGHANMLDTLMIDLANAEQEQERWFNTSVSGAKQSEPESTQQWSETIVEEPAADWQVEDAESTDDESDYEEDKDNTTVVTTTELDSDDEEEDDEASYGDLALHRTTSRHSPPELSSGSDSDSDSEDEHMMPPSPPQPAVAVFSEKQRQAIATTSFYDVKDAQSLSPTEQASFEQEGFYLPSRQQPTIIAAY